MTDCAALPELWAALRAEGLPDQQVQLADFAAAGRGLAAAQHIEKGSPLLQVWPCLSASHRELTLGAQARGQRIVAGCSWLDVL